VTTRHCVLWCHHAPNSRAQSKVVFVRVRMVCVHHNVCSCLRMAATLTPPTCACHHFTTPRYCKMCFTILHRKGNRVKHTVTDVDAADIKAAEALLASRSDGGPPAAAAASPTSPRSSVVDGHAALALGAGSAHKRLSPAWFAERCRFIPVRLQVCAPIGITARLTRTCVHSSAPAKYSRCSGA
jgi:hypothetical protein